MLCHLGQQEKKTKEHLFHLALKRNSSLDRKISEPVYGVFLNFVHFFFSETKNRFEIIYYTRGLCGIAESKMVSKCWRDKPLFI